MDTLLPFPDLKADALRQKRADLITQVMIDVLQDVPIPALLEAIGAGRRRLETGANVFQSIDAGMDAVENWRAAHKEVQWADQVDEHMPVHSPR